MKQIVNANISYLIHLIGCALDNTIPEELPQDVTWKDIYQLAKYHSINNLIFYSIEKLAKKPDEEQTYDLYAYSFHLTFSPRSKPE